MFPLRVLRVLLGLLFGLQALGLLVALGLLLSGVPVSEKDGILLMLKPFFIAAFGGGYYGLGLTLNRLKPGFLKSPWHP